VKWAPNLASFDAAFCFLLIHVRQGSNPESLPSLSFVQGARFGLSRLPLPTICLLISVSSNGLMDQIYIKAATRLRDEMVFFSSPSPIFDRPAMVILRSSYKAAR